MAAPGLTSSWMPNYLPTFMGACLLMAIGLNVALIHGMRLREMLRASTWLHAMRGLVPRSGPAILRALPWTIMGMFVVVGLMYISRVGPNDDAFITYRVARNLAGGDGPVYNPGERVLSITTPGYMLLLAAASAFSKDFVALGLVLNGLALLLVGALVIDLSLPRAMSQSSNASDPTKAVLEDRTGAHHPDATSLLAHTWDAAAAVVAVTLTLIFPLLNEALGMETPLYIAALLATFAAYRRALGAAEIAIADRWLVWTAVAAAMALLLRPDGILAGIAVGIHWLVARRRLPWRALAVGLLLSLPWVLFAWAYYGSPIPNTLAAKATQAIGSEVPRWGRQLVNSLREWVLANPVSAVLAAVGLVTAMRAASPGRWPMLLWTLLYVTAHTLLNVRSYFWYYAPLAPVLGLLAGDGVRALGTWLSSRTSWFRTERALGLLPVLVLIVLTLYSPAAGAVGRAREAEPRRRDLAYRQTAEVLRERCAGGEKHVDVGMAEIGLIGYLSNCPIVDFAGLLQEDIAHLELSPPDKIGWAIKRYAPPLVHLSGGTGYPLQVANASWFRQRYEPITLVDEDGLRSAVYRRGLGPSEQRDLGLGWWREQGDGPATTTLAFEPGTSPVVAIHAFLPPGSVLGLEVGSQPLAKFQGDSDGWQDLAVPVTASAAGPVTLKLSGSAVKEPAAVGWVTTNAVPSIHYFVPLVDAAERPRPTGALDPGASVSVDLARPEDGTLQILHRDRPGVRLRIGIDGQTIGVVGGTDGWKTEVLPLPVSAGMAVEVTIANEGTGTARLSHVALVPEDLAAVTP